MGRVAAYACALAALAACPTATADEISRGELAEAALSAAAGDGVALDRIGKVTSVDGTPSVPGKSLEGANGGDLERRLAELGRVVSDPGSGGPTSEEARASVEAIESSQLPREDSEQEEAGSSTGGTILGLPSLLAFAIAIAALAVGIAVAASVGRRSVATRDGGPLGLDPDADLPRAGRLERDAAAAAKRGDYATSVRLRFEAGLLRLGELGAVRQRPSLTASGAVRETGVARLGPLADSYQRIRFGGRPAAAGDDDHQREGWKQVLAEVRSR